MYVRVMEMAKGKIGLDLRELISSAEKGIIDLDHYRKWNQFKKEWSKEDAAFWNGLKNRMIKDGSGTLKLDPPPSADEKAWAKRFVRRAEEKGLC
jgi:hypothetical protein